MIAYINARTLIEKTPTDSSVYVTDHAADDASVPPNRPAIHPVAVSSPGTHHPPRKRVTAIAVVMMMFVYSAVKKSAHLKPEYST